MMFQVLEVSHDADALEGVTQSDEVFLIQKQKNIQRVPSLHRVPVRCDHLKVSHGHVASNLDDVEYDLRYESREQ